jgi:hypothetical protein
VKKVLLLVLVLAIVWFLIIPFARATKPVVGLTAPVTVIGQATPVSIHVTHPKGVRSVTAVIEQNGKTYQVWALPQATKDRDSTFNFDVGAKSTPQLQDGKATLIVEAASNGFPKKTTKFEQEVRVITRPPTVSADSDQHYLYVGMADVATMDVTGTFTDAGVKVGDQKFRAWPMPDGKPGYFVLYAVPWYMNTEAQPLVYASNGVGNDVTTTLNVQFPKKEQPHYTDHELNLDDKFIQKVVGELDPNGSGDMVARFVKINSEMRKENNKTLADLTLKTADHWLWSQPFLRQPGAKSEATFADHRKYIYQGKVIDQQVHLGYDLAVTQHVGVQASNDGVVVYAAPLGIYGNCIVVDHGYGLQTIYGHMSRIDVKVGDAVKRGQVMGLSGMTGMAGGDHIHFSMQLDGLQIDPKEFWDAHWIQDHIVKRVGIPGWKE